MKKLYQPKNLLPNRGNKLIFPAKPQTKTTNRGSTTIKNNQKVIFPAKTTVEDKSQTEDHKPKTTNRRPN